MPTISLVPNHIPRMGHDPVADQRADDPLTPDELAFGLASLLVEELNKRDLRIDALEAALRQRDAPDLDGRVNVKRAAERLACSYETVRRKCAQGKIEAAKDRGQWWVKI